MISRRAFATGSCAAMLSCGLTPRLSLGAPQASLGSIPVGLQLYTVNDEMKQDLEGTLRKVASIGYKSVELPGLYGRSARELKNSIDRAGLICDSGHFSLQSDSGPDLQDKLAATIDAAKVLGMKYIVCPTGRIPGAAKPGMDLRAETAALTLDDFRRIGEILNHIGAETRKAGIQFAYHNHNFEFRSFNGVTGYDELLRVTNPQLVQMELDCGWVMAAGHDPARYLSRNPGRFPLLHVKDLAATKPNTSFDMNPIEVGSGTADWKSLLRVAKATGVKACYVEQEPPFARPALESAKISFDYLEQLKL